ncbi:MAG: FAD-dependent oxidoreductase [Proteobacteria bacterium]|nr:FAD-dependent oxidoreductase [Pseudomonadota bacterium]
MDDHPDIAIIGGGIVGITSALELRRRGHRVVLLDRGQPGRETSYGNTGVLSDASIVIVNNPGLLKQLPKLVRNTGLKLRYSPAFVLKRLFWVLRFLSYCTRRHFEHAAAALRAIQVLSLGIHKALIAEAGVDHLLRHTGWLKVFRSQESFRAYDMERGVLEKTGVRHTVFSADQLAQIEPGLARVFVAGVLMEDTCSVSSPAALCDAYVALFVAAGGEVRQAAVTGLERTPDNKWRVILDQAPPIEANSVVLAAGPWSAEIAAWLGYKIPMAWERGYHVHLEPGEGPALTRAVHDIDRGYVMSPQLQGVRVTSGSELTDRDAPPNYAQINEVAAMARDVAGLGEAVENTPWMGRRPTLVDSLPMIGKAPRHDDLWFNFGHHHTGLSMSAGSARIIADLIDGKAPPIDATPFRPNRFRL